MRRISGFVKRLSLIMDELKVFLTFLLNVYFIGAKRIFSYLLKLSL